jgi:alpha-L-arabinofuranosidase
MKRLVLLIPIVLLAGCLTTTPVKRNFPEVPKELMEVCPDLKTTEQTEKLSEVLKVVVDNYGQYHECKIKVDTWMEWYKTQKQIFDSVK